MPETGTESEISKRTGVGDKTPVTIYRRESNIGERVIGSVFGVLGVALTAWGLSDFTLGPGKDSRSLLLLGLFFTCFALAGWLYRNRLEVNDATETWVYTWGIAPFLIRKTGNSADIPRLLESDPQSRDLVANEAGVRWGRELPPGAYLAAGRELNRRKYLVGSVIGGIIAVTMANALLDGPALVCQFTDRVGTRYQWASTIWREEWNTEETGSRLSKYGVWGFVAGPVSAGGSYGSLLPRIQWPVRDIHLSVNRLTVIGKGFEQEAAERKATSERNALLAERAILQEKAAALRAALGPSPSAAALNRAGNAYQAAGDWEQAVSLFTQALTKAATVTDQTDALGSIATCYMAQNREPQTVAALKSLLAVPGCDAQTARNIRATLERIANRKGTLHERLLTIPGDRFPGEEFNGLGNP